MKPVKGSTCTTMNVVKPLQHLHSWNTVLIRIPISILPLLDSYYHNIIDSNKSIIYCEVPISVCKILASLKKSYTIIRLGSNIPPDYCLQ